MLTKNWCLIPLLNIDDKTVSNALAVRLKDVLLSLITH